jgi:hypothetical protein
MVEQSENPEEIPENDLEREEKLETEQERLAKLVEATAIKLGEHFDSVRIVVTMNAGDGVYSMLSRGTGNFFAQRDSVREWLMMRDQESKNEAGN